MTAKFHIAWLMALALVIAACGQSDDPAPASEQVAEPAAETTPAETTEQETAEPAEDAVQSVVEESAAEPEPEEQTIVLAEGGSKPSQQKFKYEEGKHYTRFVPTQPTMGGPDKVEVAEFFWFGCPHCYDLEPFMNRWEETMPANVRLVRIPVTWNRAAAMHAKLFYTTEALAASGAISDGDAVRNAVFAEFHQRGNRLLSEDSMKRLVARFGASAEDFDAAWNSFDVDRKLRMAQDLTSRYSIEGVPAIVVNGKYKTGAGLTGGNAQLIEAIDELIARETIR